MAKVTRAHEVSFSNAASTSQNQSSDEEFDNPYSITEDVLRQRLKQKSSGRFITQFYAAVIGKLDLIN